MNALKRVIGGLAALALAGTFVAALPASAQTPSPQVASIGTAVTQSAIASNLLAPAKTAGAFKACGRTWTTYYNPGYLSPLYKVEVFYKSLGKNKGIKICLRMKALSNPKGRKMTIKTSKPYKSTKSTKKSSFYIIRNVKPGNALKGKVVFKYTNPAYKNGVRTVASKFNIPVT